MEPGHRTAVVLLGANGQLGTDLRRQFDSSRSELVAMSRADLDIRNHDRVAAVLGAVHPAVVVNTAAFHKVEACEADVEQSFAVNSTAIRNLALVAERLGARLVHLSTDYVFDGDTSVPYAEDTPVSPINVYGTSKAAGEFFVRSLCTRHLIIRTSGLYGLAGSSGKGGNFIQTMLRLGRERGVVSVVNDQTLSPTYTLDLATMIWKLVQGDAEGVFHVTNAGSCSWYELACSIFELSGMQVEVQPISTESTGAAVRRPRYSVLANRHLNSAGFEPLRPWKDALPSYLEAIGAPTPVQTTVGS